MQVHFKQGMRVNASSPELEKAVEKVNETVIQAKRDLQLLSKEGIEQNSKLLQSLEKSRRKYENQVRLLEDLQ